MVIWELFTKEEHEKIERKIYSFKNEEEVEKFSEEAITHHYKTRDTERKERDLQYVIMAYLADKE
jgi:hypothetical protein